MNLCYAFVIKKKSSTLNNNVQNEQNQKQKQKKNKKGKVLFRKHYTAVFQLRHTNIKQLCSTHCDVQQVLHSWFLYKEKRLQMKRRMAVAMESRRVRLVRGGASQWLRVAGALAESRAQRATQQQVQVNGAVFLASSMVVLLQSAI